MQPLLLAPQPVLGTLPELLSAANIAAAVSSSLCSARSWHSRRPGCRSGSALWSPPQVPACSTRRQPALQLKHCLRGVANSMPACANH